MTDITANVIVSMPSQLFTMARSFKAVANGKIYIGKIDTDPVNPENQIQVYVENEDGSHVPVSQPIIINAAGYPVYNGQIAKFVTEQGHSMAVYDAYGAKQFYFPNVLKYDPDQFQFTLSSDTGANLVGIKRTGLPNNNSTTVGAYYQTTPINAVTDYGMKGDFDPSTGFVNGTNNRSALQQLMDDLVNIGGNKTVTIPPGNYYFNFDGSTNPGGVGVMWGRVGAGLKNVTFLCYGATFYSGSIGRLNGIFSANYGVRIKGLRVIGFGGGTLAPSREKDCIFALAYNCCGVTFDECYFANSMGDCVYLGGSLDDGSITGLFCRDIAFNGCTLKERYGDGIRSYYSGSRSRLAIAVIDCVGLKINNCKVIGGIDFEPNATNQRLQNITVSNLRFHAGNILAYTGTNPFYEEPINSGTQVIRGDIRFQTRAGGVITQNILISNASFDYGCIRQTAVGIADVIYENIRMHRGILVVGHDSGTNYNPSANINNVHVDLALNGSDDDVFELKGSGTTPPELPAVVVLIQGNLTYARFNGISGGNTPGAFSYLFYADPSHVAGDMGRSIYANCNILGGNLYNYTLPDSSQELGNTSMPVSGVAFTKYRRINTDLIMQSVGALSISASGSIDWNAFRTSKLAVTATTTGLQISGIVNGPMVGAEVQIRNSGSNPIILAHSTSFYLKGTTSATLDDTRKVVTFQYISSGVWTEIYRNF